MACLDETLPVWSYCLMLAFIHHFMSAGNLLWTVIRVAKRGSLVFFGLGFLMSKRQTSKITILNKSCVIIINFDEKLTCLTWSLMTKREKVDKKKKKTRVTNRRTTFNSKWLNEKKWRINKRLQYNWTNLYTGAFQFSDCSCIKALGHFVNA